MNYLDELNNKKNLQSDEQKRLEQIEAVNASGEKIVGAVENSKQELTGSLNNLLMATLVSKDPEIAKTAKSLVNLSSQIDKATQNIKDANFKPLSDNLKVLQSTLKDIPGQIEQALQAQDPSQELREIATKLGQIKYDPNIKVDVSAPKVDFTPITKLLSNIEKAFKDFKVELPESDFGALQSEVKGVKSAINNLVFPTANYVLPFSKDGKATQVVLDASGNVPISGSISVDTTGLATGTKQDAQTALLTTIDADTGAIKTAVETIDNAIAGSEMQVDVVTSALPSGAATSAKQDTMIGHLDGVEGLLTTIDSDTGSLAVVGSGTEATAQRVTIATDSTGVLSVDDNGSSLTVDGSVTANAGTNLNTSALALDTTLTGGTQKSQIVDAGGDAVTVTGGKLDVNATISGSGGGTSAIDDSAFTVASDSGTPTMGLFDDVTPDSVNEGDVGVVRMSANRNAYTTIRDAAGNERGVNVTAGNALTVDASATTQPVSHAALTELAAAIDTEVQVDIVGALPAGTNNIGDVDVVSSALPTGASTSANQTTLIGHVDGIETLIGTTNTTLGTIDADTGNISTKIDTLAGAVSGTEMQVDVLTMPTVTETNSAAIKTAVETIDNAISGSEMQVDVVGALPAGTNAIGKLSANSGVDIGDVDVTSAVTGTIDHGSNQDIDTAAEQITATSFACKFGVTLRADSANTGTIYIGNSDVTVSGTAATDGIPLYPGDSLFLPVTNSNIPYAIASANNQKIFWIAA